MKSSPYEAASAFEFLVSLSVRLLIASTTRSGSIEEAIAGAALQVYRGSAATTSDLKSHLNKITPNNSDFEEAFALTAVSKPDYARYYLRTLEKTSANVKEPWMHHNEGPAEITLEHILPRNPSPGEWTSFDPDSVRKYSRRLGNMCLL